MRIPQLVWSGVLLGVIGIVGSGCQSGAKRPIAVSLPVPAPPALAPQPVPSAPEPTTPKEEVQTKPEVDSLNQILAEAEKEYQAGQANYTSGHPDAAKANFERAFDLLAKYPGGTSSDERLQREFDKVMDAVSLLEPLDSDEAESPSAEQKSEPAPIDEANETAFPVDPGIKAKAEAEIKETHSDLPLVLNDTVASYINYYSSRGRGVLERALTRAGLYRDMILRVLKEEGVPQDLIYLAEAESGFHPLALSRMGARGMWQFMASRASGYGLSRNRWLDERQDPEKSTRAAARHLKDLYKQFGDWYLAMAAYNSGPLTVQKAVQRTGYADFWELYRRNVLPPETRNYVPIIVAVTVMAKNPEQYGLDSVIPERSLQMDRLMIDYSVDLRLVADCLDTPLSTLQELNPSLLRMSTPKEVEFELHLPVDTAEKYQAAITAIPRDKRALWRYRKVLPQDTLATVARSYRTTAKAITTANHLQGDDLEAGSKLIIPIAAGHADDGVSYSRRATRYRVRKGDTLSSVAENFGVSVERLRRWNRLRRNYLRPGRTLSIHLPVAPGQETEATTRKLSKPKHASKIHAAASSKPVLHRVRPGETLTSIANVYKTTVTALRRDNSKVSANLHAGDVLVIRENR